MEQLSNELFKWLQGDTETSVYCVKKAKQDSPSLSGAPLAPPAKRKFTPIRGSAWPKRNSAPLTTFKGSRAKGKTTDYFGINGEDRVSRNSW